jgi:hypothetical protein
MAKGRELPSPCGPRPANENSCLVLPSQESIKPLSRPVVIINYNTPQVMSTWEDGWAIKKVVVACNDFLMLPF